MISLRVIYKIDLSQLWHGASALDRASSVVLLSATFGSTTSTISRRSRLGSGPVDSYDVPYVGPAERTVTAALALPLLYRAGVAHAHVSAHVEHAVYVPLVAYRALAGLSGGGLEALAPLLEARGRRRLGGVERLVRHRVDVGGGSRRGHGTGRLRSRCSLAVDGLLGRCRGRQVGGLRGQVYHEDGAAGYGRLQLDHVGEARNLGCGCDRGLHWGRHLLLTLPRRRARGSASQHADALGAAVDVDECPQLEALVHVHDHVRGSAVFTHLHLAEVGHGEGDLVAVLGTRGDVLGDYPVLRTVKQEVAVVGQVVGGQSGGVAGG